MLKEIAECKVPMEVLVLKKKLSSLEMQMSKWREDKRQVAGPYFGVDELLVDTLTHAFMR